MAAYSAKVRMWRDERIVTLSRDLERRASILRRDRGVLPNPRGRGPERHAERPFAGLDMPAAGLVQGLPESWIPRAKMCKRLRPCRSSSVYSREQPSVRV